MEQGIAYGIIGALIVFGFIGFVRWVGRVAERHRV